MLSKATRSELTSLRSSLSDIGAREADAPRSDDALALVADVDRDSRVALAVRGAKRVHQRRRQTIVFLNRRRHVRPHRHFRRPSPFRLLRGDAVLIALASRRWIRRSASARRDYETVFSLTLIVTSGDASSAPVSDCILYVILILEKFRRDGFVRDAAACAVARLHARDENLVQLVLEILERESPRRPCEKRPSLCRYACPDSRTYRASPTIYRPAC